MMTLDQWKTTRRVDHEQLVFLGHVFNRRMRPRPDYADLKVFDDDVLRFHLSQAKFDKIGYLGDIIADTDRFLANAPKDLEGRYLNAVRALQASAKDELTDLCGATSPPDAMAQDIIALGRAKALTPKAATLKVYSCLPSGSTLSTSSIDARINSHLVSANQLFDAAGVQASRINATAIPIPATFNDRPFLTNGRFDEVRESAFVLVKYCNSQGGAAAIHVVYVDRFADDDVQGFTCRRGKIYSGATADRPIVVVTLTPPVAGAGTYTTTLAHELTHALTSEGTHADLP
ncbi:MAG TPA: hypothetical protein VMU54_26540, partial [Planctomycetota bacterium]|nr:hypothetical protein [Planctomycetota bacterium]